ncbi:MAG TPA: hypothetical protein VE871_20075 [Longimicrobium sp.]|nr:hypothetical protein [Longimicrobium sp.]
MSRIRIRHPFGAIAFAVVVACTTDPITLCGCSMPGPYSVLYGRVTDPAGTPVAGATVHWETGPAGCATITGSQDVPIDASGGFHAGISAAGDGPEQCIRLAALPPAGSALRGSDTVQITVPTPRSLPADSVRRDLVLRAR